MQNHIISPPNTYFIAKTYGNVVHFIMSKHLISMAANYIVLNETSDVMNIKFCLIR